MLRFPRLIESIIKELDNKSLSKCREIDRSLCEIIDQQKFFWLRRIQMYPECIVRFYNLWKLTIERTPLEILKRLALVASNIFQFGSRDHMQFSPHQIALSDKNLSLYQYICGKTGEINPMFQLHTAASVGNFEITRFIIENVQNKNPRLPVGLTPLHMAAKQGHLEI